jgi:catechol 2,3-dioxygenase-like lactoylglutathione lyase family enzyme
MFKVPLMFHPTHIVNDLEEAGAWFQRVFGRGRITWGERWDLSKLPSEYPVDYSFWVMIGDVVHDVLCPSLYIVDSDAVPYGDGGGLAGISWWVEDSSGFASAMEKAGVTLVDQANQRVTGGRFAKSLLTDEFTLMSMKSDEVGFPHTFSEILGYSREGFARVDHRLRDGWVLPPPPENDPLGVVAGAWHTIATDDVNRAVWLFTDVLGGREISRGIDPVGGAEACHVAFASTVVQIVPQREASTDAAPRQDRYDSLTLKVRDLEVVREHLVACGIGLSHDDGSLIRTDAKDCLGATWGFTETLAPNDPRVDDPAWAELSK